MKLLNVQFSQLRVTSSILEPNIFFNTSFSVCVHKKFPHIPHLERKTYTYEDDSVALFRSRRCFKHSVIEPRL
jgi:hypothetical protein